MLIHGEPAELQLAGLFGDSRNKFAWLTIEIQVRKDVPARSVPPQSSDAPAEAVESQMVTISVEITFPNPTATGLDCHRLWAL